MLRVVVKLVYNIKNYINKKPIGEEVMKEKGSQLIELLKNVKITFPSLMSAAGKLSIILKSKEKVYIIKIKLSLTELAIIERIISYITYI